MEIQVAFNETGAVAAKGVADYQSGNVSSVEDYMKEAFIGTVVGLVTGAIGGGFSGAIKAASGQIAKRFGLTVLRGVVSSGAGSAIGQLLRADLYGQPIDPGDFFKNLGISMLSGGIGSGIGYPVEMLTRNLSPALNAVITSGADGIGAFGINLGTQSLGMLIDGNFDPDNLDYQAAINDAVISAGSAFAGTMANRASAKQQPTENTSLGQEQGRVANSPPELPEFDGKTTRGVLVASNGEQIAFTSGSKNPPSFPLYPQTSATHVEGKAALYMRTNGIMEGTVYHNNTNGTCGFCDMQVPALLPEGAQLVVIPPANASANNARAVDVPKTYTGNSTVPKTKE